MLANNLLLLCSMLAFQFMAAEVIYARVPKTLKEAADAFASERGKTLTGAVIELLECGLMAISNERSIVELEKNLAEVSAEKSRVVADLHAADAEVNALRTFGQRAARPIGTCPNSLCSKSISGSRSPRSGAMPPLRADVVKSHSSKSRGANNRPARDHDSHWGLRGCIGNRLFGLKIEGQVHDQARADSRLCRRLR